MLSKKRKTVGRSFRVDEEWLNVLAEEAERQGISVNSLLNRILQQYAYLRFILRFGAITLTRKGFVGILECCPDEKISENGLNAGSAIVKDLLLTMGVKPNYSFVLCLVKKLLAEFSGWFECDHHIMEDKEILHLRHELGMKWSLYLSGVATGTFNSILDKQVNIEHTDSSVTITIPKTDKQP